MPIQATDRPRSSSRTSAPLPDSRVRYVRVDSVVRDRPRTNARLGYQQQGRRQTGTQGSSTQVTTLTREDLAQIMAAIMPMIEECVRSVVPTMSSAPPAPSLAVAQHRRAERPEPRLTARYYKAAMNLVHEARSRGETGDAVDYTKVLHRLCALHGDSKLANNRAEYARFQRIASQTADEVRSQSRQNEIAELRDQVDEFNADRHALRRAKYVKQAMGRASRQRITFKAALDQVYAENGLEPPR